MSARPRNPDEFDPDPIRTAGAEQLPSPDSPVACTARRPVLAAGAPARHDGGGAADVDRGRRPAEGPNVDTADPAAADAQPFSADGGRVGVVVSHGFTGTPASMRPWAQHLADAGFSVRLPLLPGHGGGWRDTNRTRWPQWYGAVEDAYDELRARLRRRVRVRAVHGRHAGHPAGRAAPRRRRPRAGQPGLRHPAHRRQVRALHLVAGQVPPADRRRHQEARRGRARRRPHAGRRVRLALPALAGHRRRPGRGHRARC